MIERLSEPARRAAEIIEGWDFVHVLSHHDADGITAAAIMAHALDRRGIPFQVTNVEYFNRDAVDLIQGNAVLCDMGSGSGELSNRLHCVIIDHHPPAQDVENHQVNPHLVDVDGATQLSASGATYCVAREMGQNGDLAGLAIAGAIGDRQNPDDGVNADILAEGEKNGFITRDNGFLWGTDDLKDALTYSLDPYLQESGDAAAIDSLIEELGIPDKLSEMDGDQRRKLGSVLTAQLLARSGPGAVKNLIGPIYRLSNELIPDARLLANIVDSCGRMGRTGLGLALCLRDEVSLFESQNIHREHFQNVIAATREAEAGMKTLNSLRYFTTEQQGVVGLVASTLIRYRFNDLPIAAVNLSREPCKISVRGTHELVARGLDLSRAVPEAVKSVGGTGGGHNVAAGAGVPSEKLDEFLECLDRLVGEQLNH